LQEDLIWAESCPSHIISDGGKQFTSDFAKDWFAKQGILHSATTPFHQQANGMAERSIRTFKDILVSKLVNDKMRWKEALKASSCAMNNFLKNGTTGKTPFEILNGQLYNSPVDNLVQNKISLGKKIKMDVAQNSERMKLKQLDQYNSDKSIRTLQEGDWALVFNHYKSTHKSPSWLGPFKVLKTLENDNYLVYNHLSDKYIKSNIQFLKKFFPSESPSSDNAPSSPPQTPVTASIPSPTAPAISPSEPPTLHKPLLPPPLAATPSLTSLPDVDPSPVSLKQPESHTHLDPYIGRRVEVFWPSLKKWLPGTVDKVSDDPSKGTHEVAYDDERHYEDPNTYEFLKGENAARFRFTGEEYDEEYDDE